MQVLAKRDIAVDSSNKILIQLLQFWLYSASQVNLLRSKGHGLDTPDLAHSFLILYQRGGTGAVSSYLMARLVFRFENSAGKWTVTVTIERTFQFVRTYVRSWLRIWDSNIRTRIPTILGAIPREFTRILSLVARRRCVCTRTCRVVLSIFVSIAIFLNLSAGNLVVTRVPKLRRNSSFPFSTRRNNIANSLGTHWYVSHTTGMQSRSRFWMATFFVSMHLSESILKQSNGELQ